MAAAILLALGTFDGVCASGRQGGPAAFDSTRAYNHLREIVAIGPRPAGSAGLDATRGYIRKQLAAVGVEVREQAFVADTPVGRVRMVNLIATIPGQSKDRLVFGGHYDTKLFREFRFVGANDAGSSTAFLIEWARVLKARKNALTSEIVFFDGEEAFVDWYVGNDNTYGSRHYVDTAKRDGSIRQIRAMVLVDMIGDRDLHIRRELYSTRWLTDIIWAAARRLGHQAVFLDETTQIEDDHIPFLRAGIPAVNIIDGPEDYPPWHTAGDTLDKVSARSLQIVGDVLFEALPAIEKKLQ
ncbi:MAG TPA: M28 family peptidase [Vicinamibacterales bacterium]|nr:M28 family peptidase [Vicinamibacterales bacterium]